MERIEKEFGDDSGERGRPDDEHGGGRDNDKSFGITINYNGLKKPLDVEKDETIGSVREKAIALHGITTNPHLLGLFPKEGPELSDGQTVKQAKVKKGDELLLRPSAVRAG
jgi:hypothetical protein